MRISDWLLLWAHAVASAIDGTTDEHHLTTDPACVQHVAPKRGSRLDRVSRGVSCMPCMRDRAWPDRCWRTEPVSGNSEKGETK